MDKVLQKLNREAELHGRTQTPCFQAPLNQPSGKGGIQLPLRAVQKPELYLKWFLHSGRLLLFLLQAQAVPEPCASPLTLEMRMVCSEAMQAKPPLPWLNPCRIWSAVFAWSACTRSIPTCVFVLPHAGHPHWLSPSLRSREGQAIQDTQQFAVQRLYKQTGWREISLWTFSPVRVWSFPPSRLDSEWAKLAEQEIPASLWEF